MVLTAEQHLRIALLYEKAAADRLGVPPQQRAAFARKAKWFRMKARISAKKEAAAAIPARALTEAWIEGARPEEARAEEACLHGSVHPSENNGATPQEQSYRSIGARIAAVRAVRLFTKKRCPKPKNRRTSYRAQLPLSWLARSPLPRSAPLLRGKRNGSG